MERDNRRRTPGKRRVEPAAVTFVYPVRGPIRYRYPAGREDAPWRFALMVQAQEDRQGKALRVYVRHFNEFGQVLPEVFSFEARTRSGRITVDVLSLGAPHE